MTDLSSAAQAVLNAFGKHPLHHDNPSHGLLYGALPAALRTAAYQLEDLYCEGEFDDCNGMIKHFLLIADEIGTL